MDIQGTGAPETAAPEATADIPTGQPVAMTFLQAIDALVVMVQSTKKGREASLVVTKLQEAKHWWLDAEGVL